MSHSRELASGLAELIGQVAGPEVSVIAAGGTAAGSLGTSSEAVEAAIAGADAGDGVVVLADLGSAILTIRDVLKGNGNGHVKLADAPFVEGAVAAAVTSASGTDLAGVVESAEAAWRARKL